MGLSDAVTSRISSIQEAFKDTERSTALNTDGLRQRGVNHGVATSGSLSTRQNEHQSVNSTFGGFGGALVVAETAALAAAALSSQRTKVPKAVIEEALEHTSQTEVEPLRNCSKTPKPPLQMPMDKSEEDPETLGVENEPEIGEPALESQLQSRHSCESVEHSPKCFNPSPHTCLSSCQSSQCCISSECSRCCNPMCSFDSLGNPSSCSMGSGCSYQFQEKARSRTQNMNFPIDLLNSSVSLPSESERDPFEIYQHESKVLTKKQTSKTSPVLFSSSGHLDDNSTRPLTKSMICNKDAKISLDCDPHEPKGFISKNTSSKTDHHDTRSGHERTHRIIINLDDKNRFTDEVTV